MGVKFFLFGKKFLLWITKALYIVLFIFSVILLLVEVTTYGSVSGRSEVLGLILGSLFSFIFWVLHKWIKNTKFMGSIVTVSLLILGIYQFFLKT